MKARTDDERNEMIKEKKMELSGEKLCEGFPGEFAMYVNYTRSLRFEDKPDYAYLHRLFRHLFRSERFDYDNVFDWTEKRFNEVCNVDEPTSPTSTERHGD
jgi:casein kinase 1 delta/casein kinase I family protein HRR25